MGTLTKSDIRLAQDLTGLSDLLRHTTRGDPQVGEEHTEVPEEDSEDTEDMKAHQAPLCLVLLVILTTSKASRGSRMRARQQHRI